MKWVMLCSYIFLSAAVCYILEKSTELPPALKLPLVLAVFFVTLGIFSLGTYLYDYWFLTLDIKISFDPKNHSEHLKTEDFYDSNGKVTHHEKFVRVEVINTKKKTIKCKASISQIEGLEEYSPYSISKPLTWKDYEQAGEEIELPYNSPRLINVATINSIDNRLLLYPQKIINRDLSNIVRGKYVLTIQVYCGELSTEPYRIGLELKGKWDEVT